MKLAGGAGCGCNTLDRPSFEDASRRKTLRRRRRECSDPVATGLLRISPRLPQIANVASGPSAVTNLVARASLDLIN